MYIKWSKLSGQGNLFFVVSLIPLSKDKKMTHVANSICNCRFENIDFRGCATDVGAV